MQNSKNCQPPQPKIQLKFSNLIFNHHKRGTSALSSSFSSSKSKTLTRQQSIMLMKKNKKEPISKRVFSCQKQSKSMELPYSKIFDNKMNIINLSACSTGSGPKMRSHYCKKITLTNVDKYYQFCLRKVKAIDGITTYEQYLERAQTSRMLLPETCKNPESHNSLDLKRASTASQHSPIFKSNSNLLFSTTKKLQQQQSNPVHNFTKGDKMIIEPLKQQKKKQDFQYLQNSYSYKCPRHQHHHHHTPVQSSPDSSRGLFTSSLWRHKSPTNRRYLNSNQNFKAKPKKGEFIIDAWDAPDQPTSDDVF